MMCFFTNKAELAAKVKQNDGVLEKAPELLP